MNEKLQTIYNVTEEIRDIVDAECIPLEDLPDEIRRRLREGGGGGSGYTTVFVFSSVDSPGAPVSGKLDVGTGYVEGLSGEWSQNGFQSKARSASKHAWMSFAIFDGDGYMTSEGWSTPVDLAGPAGEDGQDGKPGADGKPGQNGADGMDGTNLEYIYFLGKTEAEKPTTLPDSANIDDYEPDGWKDKAQGVGPEYRFEWQAQRTKKDDKWGPYENLILWSHYGKDGKDGDGVQYIFIANTGNTPSLPDNYMDDPNYQNNEGEEYIPKDWSDDPIPVTETLTHCWVCIRRYRNGKWGPYTDPIIWDSYYVEGITQDMIVVDLTPELVMVNPDDPSCSTNVYAYQGKTPVAIKSISCTFDGGNANYNPVKHETGEGWSVTFTDRSFSGAYLYANLTVTLEDDTVRNKTFGIYSTEFDSETITLDFGDDKVLVPCSNGTDPDEGFFNNYEIPVTLTVGGLDQIITKIEGPEEGLIEFTSRDNKFKLKKLPTNAGQNGTIQLTVHYDGGSKIGYISYVKIDTKGGDVELYWLDVRANNIICDTTTGVTKYKVYTGSKDNQENKIYVGAKKYSSKSQTHIETIGLDKLPQGYKVFYAIDLEDYGDNGDIDSDYQELTTHDENGYYLEIGKENTSPDSDVSFELRHYSDDINYIAWDNEGILVDIKSVQASYQLVCTPKSLFKDPDGIKNQSIQVYINRNVARDGSPVYEPLDSIPEGYDLVWAADDGNWNHIEDASLPYTINVGPVVSQVIVQLVADEHSDDDNKVFYSDTILAFESIPGETAYVAYLTDPIGIVSCNSVGEQDQTPLHTTIKVTNGEVTDAWCHIADDFEYEYLNGGTLEFKNFKLTSETTPVLIKANFTDKEGVTQTAEATYTLVKLQIADATTVLEIQGNAAIVPIKDGEPNWSKVTAKAYLAHGSDMLDIELDDADERITLGPKETDNGYEITISNPSNNKWSFTDNRCTINIPIKSSYTDENGGTINVTKTGVVNITAMNEGEDGVSFDLKTSGFPIYDEKSEKFNSDFIKAWVVKSSESGEQILSPSDLETNELQLTCKGTDSDDNTTHTLTADNWDEGEKAFLIYVNPIEDDTQLYMDLDRSTGIIIERQRYQDGSWKTIETEPIHASFPPRDFGDFELGLSDSVIYKYGDDFAPNELTVVHLRERVGDEATEVSTTAFKNNKEYSFEYHNQNVGGLDIYYVYNESPRSANGFTTDGLEKLKDTDGFVNNDTISINSDTTSITVYLVADYYSGEDADGNPIYKDKLIDFKHVEVVPMATSEAALNYHLELEDDNISVPLEGNNIDPDWKGTTLTPYLLSGDSVQDEQFNYCLSSSESTPNLDYFTESGKSYTLTKDKVSGKPTYIYVYSPTSNLSKRCELTYGENAYELTVSKKVVKRDLTANAVLDTVNITLKKWNDTGWDEDITTEVYWYGTDVNGECVADNVLVSGRKIDFGEKNEHEEDTYKYPNLDYIRIYTTVGDDEIFEEIGVITDGQDGSSREVLYYKSVDAQVPYNPTPDSFNNPDSTWYQTYQKDDFKPSDIGKEYKSYESGQSSLTMESENTKGYIPNWSDDFPGVSDSHPYVYACERKRKFANSEWGAFSTPALYAKWAKDGADGQDGKAGKTPVIYSAGNFDATVAAESGYVGNSNQAPYVFYDENETLRGFYIAYGTPKVAPSDDNIIKKDKEVDWINIPNDAANWILMDKFNAIYSDIGKFNHALVGNWVFQGDYMFSQNGKIGSTDYEFGDYTVGDEVSYEKIITEFQPNYTLSYIIEDDGWVPNICLNQVTGEAWFAGKKVHFNADGSGDIVNVLSWKPDGSGTLSDKIEWNGSGDTSILLENLYKTVEESFTPSKYHLDIKPNKYNNIVITGVSTSDSYNVMFDQTVILTPCEGIYRITNETDNIIIVVNNNYFKLPCFNEMNEELFGEFNQIIIYPHTSCDFTGNKINSPMWMSCTKVPCNIPTAWVGDGFIGAGGCKPGLLKGSAFMKVDHFSFTHIYFCDNQKSATLKYRIYDYTGGKKVDKEVAENEWVEIERLYSSGHYYIEFYYDGSSEFEDNCDIKMMFFKNGIFGGIAASGFGYRNPSASDTKILMGSPTQSLEQVRIPITLPYLCNYALVGAMTPSETSCTSFEGNISINLSAIPLPSETITKYFRRLYVTMGDDYDIIEDLPEDQYRFLAHSFRRKDKKTYEYNDYISPLISDLEETNGSNYYYNYSLGTKLVYLTVDPTNDGFSTNRCTDLLVLAYRSDPALESTPMSCLRLRIIRNKGGKTTIAEKVYSATFDGESWTLDEE